MIGHWLHGYLVGADNYFNSSNVLSFNDLACAGLTGFQAKATTTVADHQSFNNQHTHTHTNTHIPLIVN